MRVRVHITDGQRLALITVLDNTPEPRVRVSSHTVLFDLDDPRAWLEARMAEWPRGEFPRASLHGVLRKLRSAIQSQAGPDLRPAILRRAADHLRVRRVVELGALKALLVATEELVPEQDARRGLPMRAVRAIVVHLRLEDSPGPISTLAFWEKGASRADVIAALDATAAALEEAAS